MPRRPTPLDSESDPKARFALDLRALRDRMGARAPSIDKISKDMNIARSTLYAALRGTRVPTREVLSALVLSWEGNEAEWMRRRSALEAELGRSSTRPKPIEHRPRPANRRDGPAEGQAGTDAVVAAELAQLLSELRAVAGQPQLRNIARATEISQQDLSLMFRGLTIPTWEQTVRIVEYFVTDQAPMDYSKVYELWARADQEDLRRKADELHEQRRAMPRR